MYTNPIGDQPQKNASNQSGGSIQYPAYPNYWQTPPTTKRVTETFEYDEKGRVTKRTVVTEEYTSYPPPYTVTFSGGQIRANSIRND